MTKEVSSTPAERLRIAFELFETGVRIMRQNLKRESPNATEREIEERVNAWLRHRPGAEHGDCSGPPRRWPPSSR